MRKNKEETISESADRLILEITNIWNKAYISVKETRNIKRLLLVSKNSLINRYNSMKKHSERMNLENFDILFDIKSESAHFRNEDDRLFYLDQKDKRIATIGTIDRLDSEKILKNKARYGREKLSENQKGKEKRCKRKHNIEVVNNPINEKRQIYRNICRR